MTDMDLAREMANAVLAGDEASAYALADLLSEARAKGLSLASYSAERHPFAEKYVRLAKGAAKANMLRQGFPQWREHRDYRMRLPRTSASERTALRVLLSGEGENVRRNAWLGECWRAWEAGLPVRVCGILGWCLLVTPAEVAAKGEAFFRKLDGCGPATLHEIGKMLGRHGLTLSA